MAFYATTKPNTPCLIKDDTVITYSQYWELIKVTAQRLQKLGVSEGKSVMVKFSQSIDFLSIQSAIQLAGGIFVPVEADTSDARIQDICSSTNACLFVSPSESKIGCPIYSYEKLEKIEADEACFKLPESEQTSEILFTTGTTGTSKGIEISHRGSVAVAENVYYGVMQKTGNTELIPVPVNHSYGLRRYYSNIIGGNTVVLMDSLVFIQNFFYLLDKYCVTALALVPAAVEIIFKLSKEKLGQYKNQLDYIQISTAPLPDYTREKLRRLLPNTRIYNFYGSTEAGCACCYDTNMEWERIGCIGKPTVNAKFVVMDENGALIKASAENPGLLACRGDMCMKGYWNDPEMTAEVFKNGYICSSDVGFIADDGYIYLIGRKGEIINIGGNKVAPSEIEEKAMLYPDIEDCACVPIKDAIAGQVPKLFIVLNPKQNINLSSLSQFLSENLESFKVPKEIKIIDSIPRTFNGKIQRFKLREN